MSAWDLALPIVGGLLVLGVAWLFFIFLKQQIDLRIKKKDEKRE